MVVAQKISDLLNTPHFRFDYYEMVRPEILSIYIYMVFIVS